MFAGGKVIVVMPAYNAARTLERTVREIPRDLADEIIVVDDASRDETVATARRLGLTTLVHERNRGYGANQKTCYAEALGRGGDFIAMLHPDYQYDPALLPTMIGMLASRQFDIVLGSRVLDGNALAGGMPLYKYLGNRALTRFQNAMSGASLSEYHTGYRVFSRRVLTTLPFAQNSNDFVFDNQVLAQAMAAEFRIGEVSCPAKYFADASTISFARSVRYGCGVLRTSLLSFIHRKNLANVRMFDFRASRDWA